MNCQECKTQIPQGAKQCPSCHAEVDALIGQSLLGGQYVVTRRIARGGFGVVYEAEQPTVGGRAAIKVLRGHLSRKPEIAARFQREAIVARRLQHPSAVKVYNLWKGDDGSLWIAMEFLEGETLESRLLKKTFVPEEMVGIISIVCEVLAEAHQKGIIHRDLNTRNIMLQPTDRGLLPKVIDFGIADVADASAILDSGMIMGTPSFMAPEQYRGLKFADARSDIYSLGMICYRMLSGRFPFEVTAGDALTWMFKHSNEPPIPLSRVLPRPLPDLLEGSILKALAKKPEDRYQNALSFKRDLEAALNKKTQEPQIVSSVVRGPRSIEEVLPSSPASDDEDPFLGVTLNARFLVLKKVGEGSLGSVYQANELATGRRVAIKIWYRLGPLTEATQRSFSTGKLPLSQVEHPAFVNLIALGQTEEKFLWLAEEYVERAFERTLAAAMKERPTFPLPETINLISELCEALDAAHAANLWYHALTPKNIVLSDAAVALKLDKLLDFEVAGLLATTDLIRSRMIQGEPAYTAPEQYKDDAVDHRADIYALGVLTYQMLSGQFPFQVESDDLWSWMRAHCNDAPRPLSQVIECNPTLEAVLSRALEKDPERRFSSMKAFQEALLGTDAPTLIPTNDAQEPPKAKFPNTGEVLISPIYKIGDGQPPQKQPSQKIEAAPAPKSPVQSQPIKRSEEKSIEQSGKQDSAPTSGEVITDKEPSRPINDPVWPSRPMKPVEAKEKSQRNELALPFPDTAPPRPPKPLWLWLLPLIAVGALLVGGLAFLLRPKGDCGNGKLDKKEACDDGNEQSGDGCRADCQKVEACGDQIIDAGEVCDDGNHKNGDGCRIDCKGIEKCGDGLLDLVSGEECDDGNKDNNDACSNECHIRHCGNGKVEPPEECDGGPDCGPDCLKNPAPTCGNGQPDPDEECDDGNDSNTDACLRTCKKARCGDDFVQSGFEQCDDGNKDNSDSCLNTCKKATCGDGILHKNAEQCDDGNKDNNDACIEGCLTATCGDGFLQANAEVCDDGNQENTDACLVGCKKAACGDGFVQAGVEACDDGNQENNDACVADCKKADCGDGFVQAGVEACDDGNLSNTDACVQGCKVATCGDGFVQAGAEQCDDGNQSNTDGCVQSCKKADCGDGFVQAGVEECDDGNKDDSDNCPSTCKPASCGDGFVQASTEQCDDGNDANTDACIKGCKKASCGDGFVQAGQEECDDQNDINSDGCLNTCKAARCGDGVVQDGKEQCDDGNKTNTDDCTNTCDLAFCGDGFIKAGAEECEPGAENTCPENTQCLQDCRCGS